MRPGRALAAPLLALAPGAVPAAARAATPRRLRPGGEAGTLTRRFVVLR